MRIGIATQEETDSRGQKISKKLFLRCCKLLHNVTILHDVEVDPWMRQQEPLMRETDLRGQKKTLPEMFQIVA